MYIQQTEAVVHICSSCSTTDKSPVVVVFAFVRCVSIPGSVLSRAHSEINRRSSNKSLCAASPPLAPHPGLEEEVVHGSECLLLQQATGVVSSRFRRLVFTAVLSCPVLSCSVSADQCTQVTWSYHVTLKRRDRAAAAAASESAGSIELDGAHSSSTNNVV